MLFPFTSADKGIFAGMRHLKPFCDIVYQFNRRFRVFDFGLDSVLKCHGGFASNGTYANPEPAIIETATSDDIFVLDVSDSVLHFNSFVTILFSLYIGLYIYIYIYIQYDKMYNMSTGKIGVRNFNLFYRAFYFDSVNTPPRIGVIHFR